MKEQREKTSEDLLNARGYFDNNLFYRNCVVLTEKKYMHVNIIIATMFAHLHDNTDLFHFLFNNPKLHANTHTTISYELQFVFPPKTPKDSCDTCAV